MEGVGLVLNSYQLERHSTRCETVVWETVWETIGETVWVGETVGETVIKLI
jgi:hypothetical protein